MEISESKQNSELSFLSDYISLLKPGVMSLIVFTGFTGMMIAPVSLDLFKMVIVLFAISLGSGAAAAINMWYDADIDKIMQRTKNRAIPAGRIEASEALTFGVVLAVISVLIMLLVSNVLAAFFLLIAINFYVFIYTIWLKRRTPQNIVIGGAAGAFPPLIGYVAFANSISPLAILLFTVIFLWTPPHFWALALFRNNDYKRANIPMLPVTHGEKETCKQILIYTVLLIISAAILPYFSNELGWIYISTALLLNVRFMFLAFKLSININEKNSIKLFVYSILYLFALFGVIILDYLV